MTTFRTVRALLRQHCGDDTDSQRTALGAARYWWLTHHHAGQWSDDYRRLSRSGYRPSYFECGPFYCGEATVALYAAMCADARCHGERSGYRRCECCGGDTIGESCHVMCPGCLEHGCVEGEAKCAEACEECEGEGIVDGAECEECDGAGVVS